MNMLAQTIIQGTVGFIIGAGTNDLAIRWVFRAIFAKKKHEIAKAVQRVVSEELMTPDKIAEHLTSPDIVKALESEIAHIVTEQCERPLPSLETWIDSPEKSTAIEKGESSIAEWLIQALAHRFSSPSGIQPIRLFIKELWTQMKERSPSELIPNITESIQTELPIRFAKLLFAPSQREKLCDALTDAILQGMTAHRSPFDLTGEQNAATIARTAASNAPLLMTEFASVLKTENAQEVLSDALRRTVRKRLQNHGTLGGIVSNLIGFAPIDEQIIQFCKTLPDAVQTQFSEPAEFERLKATVETACLHLMRQPWAHLADLTERDKLKQLISQLLENQGILDLLQAGSTQWFESLSTHLGNQSFEQMAKSFPPSTEKDFLQKWSNRASEFLAAAFNDGKLHDRMKKEILSGFHSLHKKEIGPLSQWISRPFQQRLTQLIVEKILFMVKTRTQELLNQSRIWDVIYQSITVYDTEKMEQVTRSIANRELLGVTLMGGVIGFLVGIAQSALLFFFK